METAPDPAQVVLDRIADLEVQRARIEAETAVLMLEHADGCRARAERHADPRKRDLEAGFAADQLGVVLHQPTKLVQDRLAQSRRIRSLMPRTWDAYLAGRIDAYRVSLIAAATAKLQDNDQRIELDQGVADYAATHTTAQLKGKLTRFVATRVTDGTAVRNERARRSVWVSHQDDGMSFLTAYIPTTDAIRIDALLTERAKRHSDDGRTFDQRRADELVAQMLGQNIDDKARSSISRAVIGVVVPVATLAGLSDQPGQSIDGSYALPADLIRDLATEPGTLFYRIIKDPLGRILDIAELGRFPSTRLGTAVDIRDGTCRFPTCTRPGVECDADHRIPHPRGPTSGDNLRDLCRRHHAMKSHGIAEPTDFRMTEPDRTPRPLRAATGSEVEADLAHFIVNAHYAA